VESAVSALNELCRKNGVVLYMYMAQRFSGQSSLERSTMKTESWAAVSNLGPWTLAWASSFTRHCFSSVCRM